MGPVREIGRTLLLVGGFLILLGLLFLFGNKIPFLGNLPGDFHFSRKNFDFYFPLGTALLLSLGLTALLNLVFWFLNR